MLRAWPLVFVFVSGCGIRGLPATDGVSCPDCQTTVCANRETLAVEYLGSGGYLLKRGHEVVLLGPFFSNPGYLKALSIRRLEPDISTIDAWLPDVSGAQAIIVGHAHYDHLLDVPWIALHRAPHARIYGSPTMAHLLAAEPDLKKRVIPIVDAYSDGDQIDWIEIPGTRIRVLPINSEHAPHFAGLKFMSGQLDEDQTRLPRRARGWVEGQTLAYLIEFLHPTEDRVMFSLHYQDAASNPTLGFPPASRTPVDAALVCVASHHQVDDYPDALLLQARPRHVVLGHWENFFAPYTQNLEDLRGVPLSRPKDFINRVEAYVATGDGESWTMPAPGATLRLVACP